MNKLSELGEWLWMEARLGAPPVLQRTVIARLHEAKEIARTTIKSQLTVYQWKGQNDGGDLTVIYAGWGYSAPMLQSLLFNSKPLEKQIGQLSISNPGETLNNFVGDITIIEAGQQIIDKIPQQKGVFVLPFRLHFTFDTESEWTNIESRFRRDARRNEIRKTERFGYDYEISRRKEDLEMFYHTMYVPTAENRHGDLASIISKREAYQVLRHGLLFLVKRDGSYVSGGLSYFEDGRLRFKDMGVLNGDQQLMKEGAVGAMNYLRIVWAHKEGYRGVNLGQCWPYMSGIYLSKRKWGAVVSVPPNEHKQIWIKIQQSSPAVTHFLAENPCVIVNKNKNLQGLIVNKERQITSEMRETWDKLYDTPGLEKLVILSPEELIDQTAPLSELNTQISLT